MLVGCRRRGGWCGSKFGTPASAFPQAKQRPCSTSSSGSIRARGRRAASASACRSCSGSAACSATRSPALVAGPRLGVLGRRAAAARRRRARRRAGRAGAACAADALQGLRVLAIDNEPRVLDGMRALLTKWGCQVAIALDLREARAALATLDGRPDVDRRRLPSRRRRRPQRDRRVAPSARRAHAGDSRHRRPQRRSARSRAAADVALLNKPLKPAPLRALLTRCWRSSRRRSRRAGRISNCTQITRWFSFSINSSTARFTISTRAPLNAGHSCAGRSRRRAEREAVLGRARRCNRREPVPSFKRKGADQ